jgi:pimeloyl-ACP methyl ester carboxylesterase
MVGPGDTMATTPIEPPWCDIAGPPEAHPIVFLHAAGWTRAIWTPQLRELASGYRVLAPDLPGHGAFAGTRFTFDAAQTVVERTLEVVPDRRVLLVGLSLGGFVALLYAARHPERLAGLVLSGCSVRLTGRLRLLARLSATVFNLARRRRVLEWLVRRQTSAVRALYPPELAEAQIAAGFYLAEWGHALLQMMALDSRDLLSRYPGPILILNGELDTYNRAAALAQAAAARNARVWMLARAGHICNLDAPRAYAGALHAFAATLPW